MPCLTCFSCHIIDFLPPSPRPLPLRGRGRFLVFLCKGLRPLHSRDLNPRGIGSAGVSGARGGARGDGRRLTLPLWYPAGGLARLVACRPCRPGTRRGACLLCRLSPLPIRYPQGGCALPRLFFLPYHRFFAPIPPAPLPLRGRGRFLVFLCKGLRPLHPRDLNPRGTCYPCPGGEDHLKRRRSSPPVPPLLGCRHCL